MTTPIFAIPLMIGFAFVANIFYTAGWVFELLARGIGTAQRASIFGLRLFRVG